MFRKSLVLAAVLGISFGGSPPYPQHEGSDSNTATYSQSLTREDVPISYKYSAVHFYTTKSPNKDSEDYEEDHQTPKYPRENTRPTVTPDIKVTPIVQYAPINVKNTENVQLQPITSTLYTRVEPTNLRDNVEHTSKYNSDSSKKYIHLHQPNVMLQYALKYNPMQKLVQENNGALFSAYAKSLPFLDTNEHVHNFHQDPIKSIQNNFKGNAKYPTSVASLTPANYNLNPNKELYNIESYPNALRPVKHLNVGRSTGVVLAYMPQIINLRNNKLAPKQTNSFVKTPDYFQLENLPQFHNIVPFQKLSNKKHIEHLAPL